MASDANRGKVGSGSQVVGASQAGEKQATEASKLETPGGRKGPPGEFLGPAEAGKPPSGEIGWAGTPGHERSRHPSVKLDFADQIGVRLRGVYDDVLAQPVPERFLDLLRQLETAPSTSFAPAKKDAT
jgi:hypothetical protein